MFKLFSVFLVFCISFMLFSCAQSNDYQSGNKFYSGGAAGTISVRNSTDKTLLVTYSGLGCDGAGFGLGLVCGYGVLEPDQISHWDYGWGVTTTWINIAGNGYSKTTSACGNATNMPSYKNYCFIDHHVVSTDAHETDDCIFTNDNAVNKLTCKRK